MSTVQATNLKHESSVTNNIVLNSSGNVGVGTSSPGSAYQLAVSGNNTGMSVQDTGSAGTWLDFKTGSGAVQGNIYFNFTNGYMAFGTAAAGSSQVERARIDSSGNFQFNSGYGSVVTAYGCRAWVNFNGTGTIAINASGNVTSITDGGTGTYTVNLTTAMPDANYAAVVSCGFSAQSARADLTGKTSSACPVTTHNGTGTNTDSNNVSVSIFR
jgi:hypothetical protein